METKIKTPKTREELLKSAKVYLTKTSKHLFITEKGVFYKIETFERDGKLYYATILLGQGNVIINVKEAISESQFAYTGNNSLNLLQQDIFPRYLKLKSLPYFKKMRAIISDMAAEITLDNVKNKVLGDKFKDRLVELELAK